MYDSDVTDAEWHLIKSYLQPTDKHGAAPKHDKRAVVNAIFYLNKAGCHWQLLPKDFPPWQTVYDHWRRWEKARGVGGSIGCAEHAAPKKNDRRATPSYGIVDSQCVKTAYASEGRKRHIVVDTLGNLTEVPVQAANEHDSKSGCEVLKKAAAKHASLEAFSGDAGCRGTAV